LMMSRWAWLVARLASSGAVASSSAGVHRHGRGRPVRLACAGAILLLSASLSLPLKESLLGHGVATASGGVLLA
ncbi:MerC domain-containing protein, partial [Stenotrophomonas maltophilia]